jgi:phosphopentomutase
VFANLVDFDMVWGHRNDVAGYAGGLADVDRRIPELLGSMIDDDLLIITADHGCDPTTVSTDHSREYAPVIAYAKGVERGRSLGIRATLSDIGSTVLDFMAAIRFPDIARSAEPPIESKRGGPPAAEGRRTSATWARCRLSDPRGRPRT